MKILMKSLKVCVCISLTLVSIFTMIICASCVYSAIDMFSNDEESEYLGFKSSEFNVVENYNDQAFFGDGTIFKVFDCSKNTEKSLKLVKDWKPLPLSQNLNIYIYGNETDDENNRSSSIPKEITWPNIENGVYKFYDLHSESTNPLDDSELFSRNSFDFCIGLYDLDTNRFYYLEEHT